MINKLLIGGVWAHLQLAVEILTTLRLPICKNIIYNKSGKGIRKKNIALLIIEQCLVLRFSSSRFYLKFCIYLPWHILNDICDLAKFITMTISFSRAGSPYCLYTDRTPGSSKCNSLYIDT